MKLISARFPLPTELKHAYSAEEAVGVVKQHLDGRIALDGLAHLRSFLALNFDDQVLNKVRDGEWLLIKPEAYYFDYTPFKEAFKQQRVMEMMASPPPQVKEAMQHMFLMTSDVEDALPSPRYYATINGQKGQRRVDALGIAQIPEPAKGAQVNLHVLES